MFSSLQIDDFFINLFYLDFIEIGIFCQIRIKKSSLKKFPKNLVFRIKVRFENVEVPD